MKKKKSKNGWKTLGIVGLCVLGLIAVVMLVIAIYRAVIYVPNSNSDVMYKPLIYIYPEEETKVSVKLGYPEKLTTTYPLYNNSWEVLARPDGTLIDDNGREYYGLYWEGIRKDKIDFKDGFAVSREDLIPFLEEKLAILGLNARESNEFVIYWLPRLQKNKYSLIRFATKEEIDKEMPLNITPEPETLIRVFMEFKGLDEKITINEQELNKVERNGYTVVEWGGTEEN